VETACALGVVKAEECLDPVRPRFASIWFQYKLWEPKEKDDEKSGVS
jgi:hypothetical protein